MSDALPGETIRDLRFAEASLPILEAMTEYGLWLVGGVVLLVILVFAEGRRQARRYGPPSAHPNLLGVGMLEVQRHLQADRHVEVLQRQNKSDQEEVDQQDVGAGPLGSSESAGTSPASRGRSISKAKV
jgi:hypothetical protein